MPSVPQPCTWQRVWEEGKGRTALSIPSPLHFLHQCPQLVQLPLAQATGSAQSSPAGHRLFDREKLCLLFWNSLEPSQQTL